jgi:hypothetical protein
LIFELIFIMGNIPALPLHLVIEVRGERMKRYPPSDSHSKRGRGVGEAAAVGWVKGSGVTCDKLHINKHAHDMKNMHM